MPTRLPTSGVMARGLCGMPWLPDKSQSSSTVWVWITPRMWLCTMCAV
ncbi:hypothetical protein KXJ72_11380 [Comamonas aquatica]|nr:hypothetical protein KXJ72_11380 [Comamonas aquatica]